MILMSSGSNILPQFPLIKSNESTGSGISYVSLHFVPKVIPKYTFSNIKINSFLWVFWAKRVARWNPACQIFDMSRCVDCHIWEKFWSSSPPTPLANKLTPHPWPNHMYAAKNKTAWSLSGFLFAEVSVYPVLPNKCFHCAFVLKRSIHWGRKFFEHWNAIVLIIYAFFYYGITFWSCATCEIISAVWEKNSFLRATKTTADTFSSEQRWSVPKLPWPAPSPFFSFSEIADNIWDFNQGKMNRILNLRGKNDRTMWYIGHPWVYNISELFKFRKNSSPNWQWNQNNILCNYF